MVGVQPYYVENILNKKAMRPPFPITGIKLIRDATLILFAQV